jgi:Protein of unknown function (DUF3309)
MISHSFLQDVAVPLWRGFASAQEIDERTYGWAFHVARSFDMRLLLIALILLLLLGSLPAWPYSTGWGYYPSGGLGLVLLILLILALFRRA